MIADLPAPESRPHGMRARYVGGCRCDACRAANTQHARDRAAAAVAAASGPQTKTHCACGIRLRSDSTGDVCRRCRPKLVFNGLVSAARAQRHLRKLGRQGVGLRAVSDAALVARTVLFEVRIGAKTQIRAETEAKILAVDSSASALVDANPTRRLIDDLLKEGFTKTALAARLGSVSKAPALQIGKRDRVTVDSALKVARLHRELELGDDVEVEDDDTYLRNLIRSVAADEPATVTEILEVIVNDYGSMSSRTLHRILASMVADKSIVRTEGGYVAAEST